MNLVDLWATDGTGVDMFRAVMSLQRFKFLLRSLGFDDVTDRVQRKLVDKCAPIRYIFEDFVNKCQHYYSIGGYTTKNEMLESFRGRCPFRQYLPNKPAKYGIKIFSLCDSTKFYTLNMEIYVGKQPHGPFKMDISGKSIVERLVRPILNFGRNVTMDNWFTSIPLSQELLGKKLTMVGTLKKTNGKNHQYSHQTYP